eukprot:Lithocolla_globosa_v1_NODE_6_length_11976_cov_15.425432.p19 type:complete len:107 gc:universal NODE_6_length_11976_cov_15.425432:9258-8938(-)
MQLVIVLSGLLCQVIPTGVCWHVATCHLGRDPGWRRGSLAVANDDERRRHRTVAAAHNAATTPFAAARRNGTSMPGGWLFFRKIAYALRHHVADLPLRNVEVDGGG